MFFFFSVRFINLFLTSGLTFPYRLENINRREHCWASGILFELGPSGFPTLSSPLPPGSLRLLKVFDYATDVQWVIGLVVCCAVPCACFLLARTSQHLPLLLSFGKPSRAFSEALPLFCPLAFQTRSNELECL